MMLQEFRPSKVPATVQSLDGTAPNIPRMCFPSYVVGQLSMLILQSHLMSLHILSLHLWTVITQTSTAETGTFEAPVFRSDT